MARYDYQCPACGTRFEVEHPMSAHPKVTCPRCGHEAERVFDPSGIVFKGSGFYNTDQRGGSSATSASNSAAKAAAPAPAAKGACENCPHKA